MLIEKWWEITNCSISVFTHLQIFVYIRSHSKYLVYWYLDSTCSISHEWVFSLSWIFSLFGLVFEFWIQRWNKIYCSYLVYGLNCKDGTWKITLLTLALPLLRKYLGFAGIVGIVWYHEASWRFRKTPWWSNTQQWIPRTSLFCYGVVSIAYNLRLSKKVSSKKLMILKLQPLS